MAEVLVPLDMWDDDREGVIVSWLYRTGATVTEGEVLCEVAVEKAQADVLSPATGTLTVIEEADAVVVRGQLIGRIG